MDWETAPVQRRFRKAKKNTCIVENVKVAALLHDIGKVEINTDLIRKASELSENEKTLLESHTRKGARLIASIFHWIR